MGRAQVDRQVLLCVARFRRGRQVARGEIFEKGTAPRSRSRAEIGSTAVQSQRRIPLSASLALCLPRRSGSFLPVRGPAVRRRSDNVDGPDALRERNRPGRPDGVDTSKLRKLRSELAASPRAFGWDADAWTGGLLSRHLQSVHGVELGLRQSQRLLLKVLRSNQPHSRSGSESSG